jgi:hypothetical protein
MKEQNELSHGEKRMNLSVKFLKHAGSYCRPTLIMQEEK